ncbi:MAG: TolC family protein [Betaproteobacteria bacterium]|nr:TolC family protein [Betaproteobacteria bacterium]
MKFIKNGINFSVIFFSIVFLFGINSCSVTPKLIAVEDIKERIGIDKQVIEENQQIPTEKISLNECIARAIKYNFDAKLKLMEISLTNTTLDLSNLQLLPQLASSAGYSSRSNTAGSQSRTLPGGEPTGTFSNAEDQEKVLQSYAISWNILDFGVSYIRSKQVADQVLISQERKRKTLQNLTDDVRFAYWRASAAQELVPQIDALTNRVKVALDRSKNTEDKRLLPPLQALNYQKSLIDTMQILNSRRQELLLAKRELDVLIGLPSGSNYQLEQFQSLPKLPNVPNDIKALENDALANRPELREEDYRKRISELEARRALLSLLPGIEASYGMRYDSNSFALYDSYSNAGLTVSGNLFKIFFAPTVYKNAKAQLEVDDARRLALSVSVLAQVHLATLKYKLVLVDYDTASRGVEIDARIHKIVNAGLTARTESELEAIRVESKLILAKVLKYSAYASAHAAFGRILNSVGYDTFSSIKNDHDLTELSAILHKNIDVWYQKGLYPEDSLNLNPNIKKILMQPEGNTDLDKNIVFEFKKIFQDSKTIVNNSQDDEIIEISYSTEKELLSSNLTKLKIEFFFIKNKDAERKSISKLEFILPDNIDQSILIAISRASVDLMQSNLNKFYSNSIN